MYRPDPGGVFDSDTHRRVLAHVPLPGDPPSALHPLGVRISPDRHHGLSHVDELEAVLGELEASGYLSREDGHFVMTDAGLEALQAIFDAEGKRTSIQVEPGGYAWLSAEEAQMTAEAPVKPEAPAGTEVKPALLEGLDLSLAAPAPSADVEPADSPEEG
jgi:hypothetical protein